jgi:antitoxin component YwqK of YwqJK toxin-antitoxin module
VASFKKVYWSWIGITSYLIFLIVSFTIDKYRNGMSDNLLMDTVPIIVTLTGILIFFITKDVTHYFNVSNIQKVVAIMIPVISYTVLSREVNPNTESINFYYIDIIDEKFYLNDELYTGDVFSKHRNGEIQFEGHVKNGKEEGEWKSYHDNGRIENAATYVMGKSSGKNLTYLNNGTLREEKNYKNGRLEGEYKLWYNKDQLEITGYYKSNRKEGEWKYYHPDIIKVDIYEMDTIIKTEYLKINN